MTDTSQSGAAPAAQLTLNDLLIFMEQQKASDLHLKPMRPGLDCPANATYFDAVNVSETGSPKLSGNMGCLFERNLESPAWRHFQDGDTYGRPGRELILRTAAVVGNYDYIMDWRFETDGTIEAAVGATGIIETKATVEKQRLENLRRDLAAEITNEVQAAQRQVTGSGCCQMGVHAEPSNQMPSSP